MKIECDNVSFSYNLDPVIQDLNFQFGKGHFYGILGPNGCGKTTLLNIIGGILKQNFGQIVIDEKNIKNLSPREIAKQLAFVKQFDYVDIDFTVEEIIMMGRYTHIERFSSESENDKEIVHDIIHKLKLEPLAKRKFMELSGGEQQKIMIARAMAQQGRILLLDEPTSHLDINYQIEFMELFNELVQEGIIVIAVLHDINLAAQFCDKVIFIKDTNIKAFGNIEATITQKNIKEVYNVDVLVKKNPFTNSIYVSPIRRNHLISERENGRTRNLKIHVIAGGGSATDLLPKLSMHDVSIGVVNVLDDDFEMASQLNYTIISEAPFSPISNLSEDRLVIALFDADLIILTNIPFGKTNLKNLLLLNETQTPIILYDKDVIENRDFTGGEASRIHKLIQKKETTVVLTELTEVLDYIQKTQNRL